MSRTWNFDVRIYYEDTDHSGAVYHANYLRYFERAREHMLGADELVRLYREDGIGFVVYKARLHYRAPAQFGDVVRVESGVSEASPFRLEFRQVAVRSSDNLVLCEADIELACVDGSQKLVKIPSDIVVALREPDTPE